MSGFVEIFFFILFKILILFFFVHINVLILGKFAHNFFYTSFHHAKILFWIDWFCFRLILNILNLFYWSMFTWLTFDTIVDAGCWLWWLTEKIWEMNLYVIICNIFIHEWHILWGIIDGKILPIFGVESWEVESKGVV